MIIGVLMIIMEHGGTMHAVSPTLMVGIIVGQMTGMVWFGIHFSIIKYH